MVRLSTVLALCGLVVAFMPPPDPAIVLTEFIADPLATPQCHASTIVETRTGLAAAWFGGTRERHPDVGIWVSRLQAGRWTPPVEVADT